MERLSFISRYEEELEIYDIDIIENSSVSPEYIVDNLVTTANVVLLLAIKRHAKDCISAKELNLIYDRVTVYIENRVMLGDIKVFTKLMDIAKDLHYKPFVATT